MTEPATTDRLAPPDPEALPLRANAYEFMRSANARLTPMFPFRGPGALVVGATLVHGSEDGYGRFYHKNSQEEVGIAFGGGGSIGRRHPSQMPGAIFVGGKMHEVRSPLENGEMAAEEIADTASFSLAVICQRQAEQGEQHESILFRCQHCNAKQFEFDYESSPGSPEAHGGDPDEPIPMDATIWGSYAAAERFNDEVAGRPCPNCGEEVERFPIEKWGWDEFVLNHRAVNRGAEALVAAGTSFLAAREGQR